MTSEERKALIDEGRNWRALDDAPRFLGDLIERLAAELAEAEEDLRNTEGVESSLRRQLQEADRLRLPVVSADHLTAQLEEARARALQAEREREIDLRSRIADLKRERDEAANQRVHFLAEVDAHAVTRRQRDEAQAGAAAMREAAESMIEQAGYMYPPPGGSGADCEAAIERMRAALTSDAGRAFLEERECLRAAVRTAEDAHEQAAQRECALATDCGAMREAIRKASAHFDAADKEGFGQIANSPPGDELLHRLVAQHIMPAVYVIEAVDAKLGITPPPEPPPPDPRWCKPECRSEDLDKLAVCKVCGRDWIPF